MSKEKISKKEPARKLKLELEIRYVRNTLERIHQLMLKQSSEDSDLISEFNKNFGSVFTGVKDELRLLRQTLVLLLLANMDNNKKRKAFLKMVDFVQEETDFQDFIDTEYEGLLNTKILKDAL